MAELEELPGGAMIARGLDSSRRGEVTAEALLVAIASRRLRDLGLPLPPAEALPRDPELALYELLCRRSEDPFFAYCALLAELDSFASSLEHRRSSGL